MAKRRLPKVLSDEEKQALLDQFNTRYDSPLRNKALVKTLLDTGLRAGEVVALRPEHIDFRACKLTVREGKGARDRQLWFGTDLRELLVEWLDRRPDSDFVFCTRDGGQLDTRYLRSMIKREACNAGIPECERVSPHTLRHTFATDLLRETDNIRVVQEALGHEDISTTTIYTHLVNGEVEEAMKGLRGGQEPEPDAEALEIARALQAAPKDLRRRIADLLTEEDLT